MTQIRLVNKAHGQFQTPLEYALFDAKISLWTGGRPIAGRVNAYMCDSCGVLKLYGVPKVE